MQDYKRYKDPEKRREYLRQYRIINRAKAYEHFQNWFNSEKGKAYRKKNKDKLFEAKKKYERTPKGRVALKRRRDKNPWKIRARKLLGRAVSSGVIKKLPCEKCGVIEDVHGHHEDYSKPLEVNWLCRQHHTEEHR